MQKSRRRFLAASLLLGGDAGWLARAQQPSTRRIEVTVARFFFRPAQIALKRGEPVTLALTSLDFVHGFSVPDFNLRADMIPGKAVEVTFTPDKSGKIPLLCDNFCGDGHERMSGFLIVSD
jgi:cytochrome c oxidase subunit II